MFIFLQVMARYNGETGIPSSSSNTEEQLSILYNTPLRNTLYISGA